MLRLRLFPALMLSMASCSSCHRGGGEGVPAESVPTLGFVVFEDHNGDGAVSAGDSLVLEFGTAVRLLSGAGADLVLPVTGDRLGIGYTLVVGGTPSQVRIVLGANPQLRAVGTFAGASRTAGSSSGLGLGPNIGSYLQAASTGEAVPASDPVDIGEGFRRSQQGGTGGDIDALQVTSLAAGDVDRDGLPDLLVGATPDRILLNQHGSPGALEPVSGQVFAGSAAVATAVADLDADGVQELIEVLADQVAIWQRDTGATSPHWQAAATIAVARAQAVAVVDIEADGAPEIVVGTASGTAILRRAGSAWSLAQFLPGPSVRAIAAADLDRNRRVEVVLALDGGGLSIHEHDVGGLLGVKVRSVAGGGAARALAVADIDRDGNTDLVAACADGAFLWINDGNGGFPTRDVLVSGQDPRALQLADFDRDGRIDVALAVASPSSGVALLHNTGTPSSRFALLPTGITDPNAAALVAADFNGDGQPDLAVAGQDGLVGVWFFSATRGSLPLAFTPTPLPHGGGPSSAIGLGDLDGDSDLDVVIGRGETFTSVQTDAVLRLTDRATLSFQSEMPFAQQRATLAIAMVDVDRDGWLDALRAGDNEVNVNDRGLYLNRNDGQGHLQDGILVHDGRIGAMAVGDLDGDGFLDCVIAMSDSTGITYVHYGIGSAPYFDAAVQLDVGPGNKHSIAIGDIDGDGRPDVILAGTLRGSNDLIVLHRQVAPRSFGFVLLPGSGTNVDYRSVELADLDGDGDLDLVQAPAPSLARCRVWLNQGAGVLQTGIDLGSPGTASLRVRTADVDGDGRLDVLLGGADGVRYWRNGWNGWTAGDGILLPSGPVFDLAVGDVDGDGQADIVVSDQSSSGSPLLWRGTR